ncbi:MAG: hypothetical protein U0U25_13510 [Flavobacteriales bacterium]
MAPRKKTTGKAPKAVSTPAASRASAKRFASTFYRNHGELMSKLSRT